MTSGLYWSWAHLLLTWSYNVRNFVPPINSGTDMKAMARDPLVLGKQYFIFQNGNFRFWS